MTTKKDPKKAEHYVNNKEFTAAVAEYSAGIKKQRQTTLNFQKCLNTLVNVSTKLLLDYRLDPILSTTLTEMK